MPPLASLQRQLRASRRKLAERHLRHANKLLSSQEPADIHSALGLLDTALKLSPKWEKALELKARALLCLRRFKDVVFLLHDFIPTLKAQQVIIEDYIEKETIKLLPLHTGEEKCRKRMLLQFLALFKWKTKRGVGLPKRAEIEQWRDFVLGQACCHLGMMEDAMILLLNVKRAASVAFRKQSSGMRDDSFCGDRRRGAESDIVTHLLENIKFLLRRRTAGLAALDAGLYMEAARHFSKILEGRKGTPQGFIAECYMHRAIAYQAAGRVTDAISDCNRALALSPACVEAFRTRAALYEIVGCFSDCLQDLEQLKLLYETALRNRNLQNLRWMRPQVAEDADIQGFIDHVCSRSASTREKLNGESTVDYHAVLGVPRGCSRVEAERAYLLISLKHRPDKASNFVDRCELVDERDIETVKDEARSSALKLFRLVQRAYAAVVCTIEQEDTRKVRELFRCDLKMGDEGSTGSTSGRGAFRDVAEQVSGDATSIMSTDEVVQESLVFSADETWLDYALQQQGSEDSTVDQRFAVGSTSSNDRQSSLEFELLTKDDAGLNTSSCLECLVPAQKDADQLVDAGLFSQAATCSATCWELANVGAIISQSLSSEVWKSSNEWSLQNCAPHLLSVT